MYLEDTLHYCITQPVAKFLISEHRKNVSKGERLLALEKENESMSSTIMGLESALEKAKGALAAQDTVISIKEEKEELTKKEKRREKWEKVGEFFKDRWKEITIAGGAFGIGVGVGYAVK